MELVADAYPTVSHMDLTFVFNPQAGGYACVAQYNTDVLLDTTVKGIVESFKTTLAAALQDPLCIVDSLDVVPVSQRRKLLGDFLGEQHPEYISVPLPLVQFESMALASPNSTCLIFEGQELSYQQIQTAVNAVAQQLVTSGIREGSAICVLVERSFELPISLFGIWKAGCIYVPLDPAYPDDRLAIIVEDSGAKAVLTTPDLKTKAIGLVRQTDAAVLLIPDPQSAPRVPKSTSGPLLKSDQPA
jgi:non-ribosomal peptide synthetase component F